MGQILYEQDYYSWAFNQANLLREGRFEQLDVAHLVEELEDLGNRHYDQLETRLMQLMAHLLNKKSDALPHARWESFIE
ncbi:DUF29 domain-containing protein [Spirulina subsalsa]|uniref:DUF29 domain-containing protein n=1 Tax=Spirulina subsalsa TaxID=54311 RepID=UPI00036EE661|nr:DUF29 domain-containing protein [Spirulina subsalsa]